MSMAYFGLMRVSELTQSDHQMKAQDVRYSKNKGKAVITLRSSKTHTVNDYPQTIEIQAIPQLGENCPLQCIAEYVNLRGATCIEDTEPFFTLSDGRGVSALIYRNCLRKLLDRVGVCAALYDCHSMRSGRARDLQELGFSVTQICEVGRWSPKSNTVYLYIRQI